MNNGECRFKLSAICVHACNFLFIVHNFAFILLFKNDKQLLSLYTISNAKVKFLFWK